MNVIQMKSEKIDVSMRTRAKAKPMFLDINVNNRSVRLEIDTGSYYNVITKKSRRKLFGDIKSSYTNSAEQVCA